MTYLFSSKRKFAKTKEVNWKTTCKRLLARPVRRRPRRKLFREREKGVLPVGFALDEGLVFDAVDRWLSGSLDVRYLFGTSDVCDCSAAGFENAASCYPTPSAATRCTPDTEGGADAQNSLGVVYKNGEGVLRDHKKARELYEKAAAQGLASDIAAAAPLAVRWRPPSSSGAPGIGSSEIAGPDPMTTTSYSLVIIFPAALLIKFPK